ncbi:MAG: TRZ/ATZ family protein [Planctomycetota bacterium]|nr:MAG: TRZ/ATZ family protein [Planctomycetota bacterium]
MGKIRKLHTPLSNEVVRSLGAGEELTISGAVFTARDMAHKRLCQLLDAGEPLPVDLQGQVIYFVGPTPAPAGGVIGAAGPTTSSRMDAFSPKLIAAGLKGMIGKGYRDERLRQALRRYGAVHFATLGGAGALLSEHIVAAEIVAYEDLQTEAIRRLELEDFPVIVAYDCHGATVYSS